MIYKFFLLGIFIKVLLQKVGRVADMDSVKFGNRNAVTLLLMLGNTKISLYV